MHDTYLIEKICQSIVAICSQNEISKVNEIDIEVDEGSHISEEHLLSHFIDRDSAMFGNWTTVHVEHRPYEKFSAIVKIIDGVGRG